MYIKSISKNKSYFIHKVRVFFLVVLSFLFVFFFSGCELLKLLTSSASEGKKQHGATNNDVGGGNTPTARIETRDDEDIYSIDEYIDEEDMETCSLKQSEIVFLGTFSRSDGVVSFHKDFLGLLKEKYTGKFNEVKTIYDVLTYMTLYHYFKTNEKSFLVKKKIEANSLDQTNEAMKNLVAKKGYSHFIRLHLFGKNEEVMKYVFENFSNRSVTSFFDLESFPLYFEEFPTYVQILNYYKYEKYLNFYTIRSNEAVLFVYDVNDEKCFAAMNDIINNFSMTGSKNIYFILGHNPTTVGSASKDVVADENVFQWCKKKEMEINSVETVEEDLMPKAEGENIEVKKRCDTELRKDQRFNINNNVFKNNI